ncbi:hypothetical protein DMH04_07030 [Kibdelosporangium aridum]|uniref:Heavy-metal-binding n=1 Tax=Kibdelosporangium aridum TaxID=2030 RepID=A0A428ZNU1_KIBAR|nr:heavy metal-binding domain-containing protein [Kibdelosporangium aridum]RSM89710.1 hypothetical protein DMH04_07030 [Kibdelosporangium aridum]
MPFTSNLSVCEHHAIRSVGFAPVGQVMGVCVRQLRTQPTNYGCVRGGTEIRDVTMVDRLHYAGFEDAADRMRQECQAIGGDGVVAVGLNMVRLGQGNVEIQAVGTAVRSIGAVRPRTPFTCDLSGQDFAKLMLAGWVPCGMVLGIAITLRHTDVFGRGQVVPPWQNAELEGCTDLVERARMLARLRLRDGCVQRGGEGIVIRRMTTAIHKLECDSGLDRRAEVLMTGTAITQFRHGDPPSPLPILRITGGTNG